MKILIIHRYFWPDSPNCGNILWEISKHLEKEGHKVKVLTALPSRINFSEEYKISPHEVVNNVVIRRFYLSKETNSKFWRIYNAIKLGILSIFEILDNKYDIVIATSIPPVLGIFFPVLASYISKIRLIYFCMDIHPEIGKISGDFANPLFFKFLKALDNWSCKRASSIIVHSSDMKDSLLERHEGNKYKIDIINNFSIPLIPQIRSKSYFDIGVEKNNLTLIFVGNIGRFQGLEDIINTMASINYRRDIELIIIGEGVMKDKLINLVKNTKANVRFFNYQPLKNIKEAIQQSDMGLVTLRPDIIKYAYPSKTMTYLEQGKPIIACIDNNSELMRTMKDEGYGFGISNNNIKLLSKLLINLADNSLWKINMKQAALKAFQRHFSSGVILNKWSKIIEKKDFISNSK